MVDEIASLYRRYDAWKEWSSFFEFDDEDAEYFYNETGRIPLSQKKVLEIGFGNGSFLAWARSRGALVTGIEINARSLKEAHRAEVELLSGDIKNTAIERNEWFDLIAAFDVLEHFDIDEITEYLCSLGKMLRPGGILILRFPNGQSPFGLLAQHGDATHKTMLSKDKIEQLSQNTGLSSVRYEGSYRIRGRWGAKWLCRACRSLAQSIIGFALNRIYACDIPWDSVVVMVMEKKQATTGIISSRVP